MRKIEFVKVSPTQNMTLLIKTPLEKKDYLQVAGKLISYDNVHAEQAGYIQAPRDPRAKGMLSMMAGEFCGNATLSYGAWLMHKEGMKVGAEASFFLEVSGAKDLVGCSIRRRETDYYGIVDMPLPERIEEKAFVFEGETYMLPMVTFPGITHILVDRALWGVRAKEYAQRAVETWREQMPEVFGILLWDAVCCYMEPLVYVAGASLVWERGCGSGTSAIGAYLAERTGKNIRMEIEQPGGTMEVSAQCCGKGLLRLQIAGAARIVAEGVAYIE